MLSDGHTEDVKRDTLEIGASKSGHLRQLREVRSAVERGRRGHEGDICGSHGGCGKGVTRADQAWQEDKSGPSGLSQG